MYNFPYLHPCDRNEFSYRAQTKHVVTILTERGCSFMARRRGIMSDQLKEEIAKELGFYDTVVKERSEEHTSELQSRFDLVCRLLLEKKNLKQVPTEITHYHY